jgi:hypothetical protein
MKDSEKVIYLVKMIDFLLEANTPQELFDRYEKICCDDKMHAIVDNIEPKLKYLTNL